MELSKKVFMLKYVKMHIVYHHSVLWKKSSMLTKAEFIYNKKINQM